MHEPEREHDRERGRRVPFRAGEASNGTHGGGRGGADDPEQEREPDDPRAREELERDAVRLRHRGSRLAVALARDFEGVGAGADERVRLEDVPRLAPPGETVVRAQAGETARVVPDLLAPKLVGDPPRVRDEADDRHESNDECQPAQETGDATAPGRTQRASHELADRDRDQRRAEHEDQSEPGSVCDTVAVGGAVLDERGPRERPRGDHHRRHDHREREQRRFDPVAAEPEPQHDPEHRRGDARARRRKQDCDDRGVRERGAAHSHCDGAARRREREREHEQRVGGERKRVPVPDRVAQPGGAAAVGEDRRNRLPGEGPRDPGAERHGQRGGSELRRLPPAGSEEEADGEERHVDERPVQLDPGQIRRHRPHDRETAPRRGREQQPREHASATGQRRPAGQRQRAPAAGDEHGGEGSPHRVAREDGAEQQRGRDRHRHTGPPHRGPS